MKKAVILLSGGLDSATVLFYAKRKGFKPFALIFDYGQRHKKEIRQAVKIARHASCPYHLVKIALPWKGSSLLNKKMSLPRHKTIDPKKIPSTYVPARNIIFLSFAVSFAEAIGAGTVFIGANALDYSGYPDCRPRFFNAYRRAVSEGMKSGIEGKRIRIEAPLIRKTKAQIVKMGSGLGVPFPLTWSCYKGGARPCGVCDSCRLRQKGFNLAGIKEK